MKILHMADVGDGLCVCVKDLRWRYPDMGSVMLIDWGGSNGPLARDALERLQKPEVFILSHFHTDHYNGLLHAAYPPRGAASPAGSLIHSLDIKRVYYPGLPRFTNNTRLLEALYSIILRTIGEESGVLEYDFLRAIRRINRSRFLTKPLFKGDVFNEGGASYKVLWPPREFNRGRTLAVVENALDKFGAALKADARLKQLYDRVSQEGLVDYVEKSSRSRQDGPSAELETERDDLFDEPFLNEPRRPELNRIDVGGQDEPSPGDVPAERPLPLQIRAAHKALQKAANYMCLVFAEPDWMLFMGDAEKPHIERVVNDLVRHGETNYSVFVTPHHGTHWDDSLGQVSCVYSLSSNGARLYPKMRLEFKGISENTFATGLNGDLRFSIYSEGGYPGRVRRVSWIGP